MIGRIRGEVLEKREDALLLDVNGIGFIVHVPVDLLDTIDNGFVTLYTYLQVRQDDLTLYGFADRESLQLFRTLLSVPGIGPRVALSILSHVPVEMLRRAVTREEIALLARVPGIGPKKARQIVFALRDKIGVEEGEIVGTPITDADSEVIAALTALGYSAAEAHAALRALPPEARDQPVEERVRLALSSLARL
ncbi:MAG: Holliday junction branch migration protein RuvA [Ardenticatenia bacterium]|jgi:Holliday junction DNA helicase RuvA|nr:MAG: Holliday junction branch migration protein RuvA [Ardenticatenia bacterium]